MLRAEFQQSSRLQNCITPKPWIVSGLVNNRWKDGKVFYKFGIRILTRFKTQQSQAYNFWLLLVVKSSLTAAPRFSFWCPVGRLKDDLFLCCICSSLFLFIIGYALKFGIKWVITLESRQFWLDRIIDLHPLLAFRYHHLMATLSFVSPCLLVILTSWTIIINPYNSSNHYHP
jgi:hypothetical protein